MKTKTTLILLAIAAILVAYIIVIESKTPTTEDLEEGRKKIFDCKASDVTRIEIDTPNTSQMKVGNVTPEKVFIVCHKVAEKWEMLQPVQTKAAQSFMENIATQLTDLRKATTVPEKAVKDLATYGLVSPTFTVAFTAKDKTYAFKIGKDAPMEQGVYLAIEGDKQIYVIARYFADLINKPLLDYRNKKVFDTTVNDTKNFKLIYVDKTIELKKESENWQIVQPVPDKADKNKITELLSAISTLAANGFVADKETTLQKYGLDKPALTLVVVDPQNAAISETLILGTEWEKDKYIAFKQGTSTIFTIAKANYDTLNLGLDQMRSKRFFDLDTARLDMIQMNYRQKPVFQIEKDKNRAWQFVYPPISATGATPYDADGLIDKLNNTFVEQFINDQLTDYTSYGLSDPFNDIEIVYSAGSPSATTRVLMSLGRMEAKSPYVFAKMADSQKLVALNSSIYQHLKQGSTLLRKKTLIDVVFDKIAKISIMKQGKDTLTYAQEKPQEWKMLAPKEEALGKNANLNDLAVEFSHLAASEFVGDTNCLEPADMANYVLDKPELIIKADVTDKDGKITTKTLLIGRKTENQYYARLEDDVTVFKVNQSLVEPIDNLLTEPPKSE